jgi:uncharacterized membrane protein YraQ (UPF0718 family)
MHPRLAIRLALAGAVWIVLYRSLAGMAHWYTFRVLQFPGTRHMPAWGACCPAFDARLEVTSRARLGQGVEFFLFQAPHAFLLLLLAVFGMGVVRSFFTPEKARSLLAGRQAGLGSLAAALLGVLTPFCSCSAVPLFIGFITAGVPLGVTFSFLIAAPLVNEVALVLVADQFGWGLAAIYAGSGVLIAMASGWAVQRLGLQRWVEGWVNDIAPVNTPIPDSAPPTWDDRIQAGIEALRQIVGKVWPYLLAGVILGAVIQAVVPQALLAAWLGRDHWWSVPAAVGLGAPLYSNAAGIIPIVQALLAKGVPVGTVLAFTMSTVGLSLPEIVILRRALKPQLLAVFIGFVTAGILAVGYLLNAFWH